MVCLSKIIPVRYETIKLLVIVLLLVTHPVHLYAKNVSVDKKKTVIKNLINTIHKIEKKHDNLFDANVKKIEKNYYLQLNKVSMASPPPFEPRDMFETQFEYTQRLADYKKKLKQAKIRQKREIKATHKNFNLRHRVSLAEIEHIEKKAKELNPVIDQLTTLQNTPLPAQQGGIEVILFPPEADKYRFPIHLITPDRKWNKYWHYKDKNKARAFWKNRAHLKAELCYQFEFNTNKELITSITTIRVYNDKTGQSRNYKISGVKPIPEIVAYKKMMEKDLPAAKLMVALEKVVEGPIPGMEFIYISPRSFMMGSPRNEPGRWANEIEHQVNLTKGFYMQTTEVTQGQWRAVMRNNPSDLSQCGSDCPVENVYWGEVQEFIHRLNKLEKKPKYRLPTEAEWEYACRAGNKNMGAHDTDEKKLKDYAWYIENSNGTTHPVASKKPNHWGLFDMHGNVSEWCSDWFGPYPDREVTNPEGPIIGKFRVARGGSWRMTSRSCRAADRNSNLPGDKSNTIGFRLVISP